ncbi:hypothetical protein [Acidovorax sp.]|uniref:hypothetical protein n=1 Tax=Acidovorax sp. TaxID=1872122 RepID=UPI00403817FB
MKSPRRGNFISEWFGQRTYPVVRLEDEAISGENWGVCPFLSRVVRRTTRCIKGENAFGVCTISSVMPNMQRDWLVCPYRVIDSEIVRNSCVAIFGSIPTETPIPISILNEMKGLALLQDSLKKTGKGFVFFQDKLGGEISISSTSSSPEIAFDIAVVEVSNGENGAIRIGRYGFIEIQTMDFHGSYKDAVSNMRDAHRLHQRQFSTALSNNPSWMSQNVEGPNIANVFKRTFYQTLLKFELSKEGAAAGTVLAIPDAVWESWQPFLGRPTIENVSGSEFRIVGSDNTKYHGTNAWIFVFELDSQSGPISPVNIKARIRVSATDLIEHAFVNVPKNMLHWATTDDVLLSRIRERMRRAIPAVTIE